MASSKRGTKSVALAVREATEAEERLELGRKAYALRRAGKSFWTIAEQLGIPEGHARTLINEIITSVSEMITDEAKRQILILEVDRLEAIHEAHWERAIAGYTRQVITKDGEVVDIEEPPDIKAAEMLLKVANQRDRLLGLSQMNDRAISATTVIVGGNTTEYIAALQQLATPTITAEAEEDFDEQQ